MRLSPVLFVWSGLGAACAPVVRCVLRWRGTIGRGVVAGLLVTVLVSRLDRSQCPGGKHVDGNPESGL
ncbi:hypothetical protein HRUBRA_00423 [Pseudohaliea rubra DSM 19751]|uniref:Uncharacterized protein n=1 Tax=Pseudohaliea rubra DSM 19751 TaxID=1265313 RepID=A0A095VU95_9GAMM|nr:hypothetical protein HRUBRA_00423 [Pseudohaliea rubra DSM 19751]